MKEKLKKILFYALLIMIYSVLFQFVWNFGIAATFNGIEAMDYPTAFKVWASLTVIEILIRGTK